MEGRRGEEGRRSGNEADRRGMRRKSEWKGMEEGRRRVVW